MEQQIALLAKQRVTKLARLAMLMARPLDHIHDDHVRLTGLDVSTVRRLCRYPRFRGPLNRAVAQDLGIADMSVSEGLGERSDRQEDLRVLLALLQCPLSNLLEIAKHCSAIQYSPLIRSCVAKSQRKPLEAIFGKGACLAALREASTYYPSLASRSCTRSDDYSSGLQAQRDPGDLGGGAGSVHPYIRRGIATILVFAMQTDSNCGRLLAVRLPRSTDEEDLDAMPVTEGQAAELRVLFGRGGLVW